MDGRRFRKWLLSVCLVTGALGCNRNAVQSPWDSTAGGQTMPSLSAKKSFWNRNSTAPTEVVETATKGPPKPELYAALADVQLAAAYDEKTLPTNREELLDKARLGYQKALQMDSKNKAGMLGLAHYYTRVGDRDKAVEMYNRYLKIYPTDRDVVHEAAMAHAQWKDWPGAVSWCERALKLDPENLTFRKTMAFCLARSGRWDDGFKTLCQVLPEAQARYTMARILEHQNQPEACKQQLQLALKADPNFTDAQEFLVELDQGYHLGGVPDPNALRQASFDQQP